MDETMMEQTGNTQEKVQGLNIVMNGITINGPMFDIHDNHHVIIHAASSSQGEVNGSAMSAAPSPRERAGGEAPFEDVIKAAEACQAYFWAQSSWAVVYCVCRDLYRMENKVAFEGVAARLAGMAGLEAPGKGTIQKSIENNSFMSKPVAEWQPVGNNRNKLDLGRVLLEDLSDKVSEG